MIGGTLQNQMEGWGIRCEEKKIELNDIRCTVRTQVKVEVEKEGRREAFFGQPTRDFRIYKLLGACLPGHFDYVNVYFTYR